jgi:phosphonopyruvate decarboxylase
VGAPSWFYLRVLEAKQFHGWLSDAGVTFYAGVPDSLLKDFCAYVTDHAAPARHVITANEGGAVALAMGHHLATGEIAVVYLQNSGLGNTVNPLTSLADPAVYGIPMLLVVGWRGEPGKKDEPQHVKMGGVTIPSLEAVGVRHTVLPDEPEAASIAVKAALADARQRCAPHALVVRKNTFAKYSLQNKAPQPYGMSREQAINATVAAMGDDAVVISTTGKPSRELFEVRVAREQPNRDLLIVGGMGHASQIALGVALAQPSRTVWCIDGDGAVLMHMGGLATIGALAPPNYKHIVLNNAAHDSVGGQPTVGFDIDFCEIARGCGYGHVARADDLETLERKVASLASARELALLEVRIKIGARADLGRPTMSPRDLKDAFIAHLGR